MAKIAYGYLYNWHAVNSGILAPAGWHVPTVAEWDSMLTSIGGSSLAGNKLKSCRQVGSPLGEGCATHNHPRWNYHLTHYGTDDYGFYSVPGGYRTPTGVYNYLGDVCYYWAPDEQNVDNAAAFKIFINITMTQSYENKLYGMSVKLVKDSATGWYDGKILTDIDGNEYDTIYLSGQTGGQYWTVQNLAVTKYNNGTSITKVTNGGTWSGLEEGAYCTYNNNDAEYVYEKKKIFRYLYDVENAKGLKAQQYAKIESGEWPEPDLDWRGILGWWVGVGRLDEGFAESPTYPNQQYNHIEFSSGTMTAGEEIVPPKIDPNDPTYGHLSGFTYNYIPISGATGVYLAGPADDIEVDLEAIEALEVGDSYGGGVVGYILISGDTGYDPDRKHGIIVSPTELDVNAGDGIIWGCTGTTIGTSEEIGYGLSNTNAIVSGCTIPNSAAKACQEHIVVDGGITYTDWYLPSINELYELYLNRVTIGGFSDTISGDSNYTSSSEFLDEPDMYVKTVLFWSGDINNTGDKMSQFRVRPVRNF